MKVTDFDYVLPEELIAQKPADKRDHSRLMVLDREAGSITHDHFYNILDYLEPGDCLVLNDSKVIPARIFGTKKITGVKCEFLLTKRIEGDIWETMIRPGRRLKPGDSVEFAPDFYADIIKWGPDGTRIVEFHYDGVFMERLDELGAMPLPPYIERPAEENDKERYQTVYSRIDGSVAAPTAGLHFTKELLKQAEEMGVRIAYVTLHVGIGTFRPVKADEVEDHTMHFEEYTISQEAAELINRTKEEGGRIISVGTTSTRTVESAAVPVDDRKALAQTGEIPDETGTEATRTSTLAWKVKPGSGSTGIFIYPGYEFKIIDCLITNFHLPKSTLLMLISALYDREKILEAYEEAKKEKYRFFSYGDAMLIK